MIKEIIDNALKEDIGEGDHSSLSCIPEDATGQAKLIVKGNGIIAGVSLAKQIFEQFDPSLSIDILIADGEYVKYGEAHFSLFGKELQLNLYQSTTPSEDPEYIDYLLRDTYYLIIIFT